MPTDHPDRLDRILETARKLSDATNPIDIWIQPGRPVELEFFYGSRRSVQAPPVSDEEFRIWGTRMLGEKQFAEFHDRAGLGARFVDDSGHCWFVAPGWGRDDWARKNPNILHIRMISHPGSHAGQ